MNPDASSGTTAVDGAHHTCSTCGAVMDVSDYEPLAEVVCPACGAVERVSGQFDQFELREIVGEGGMGVVYRAYDSSLQRFVAFKLLRREQSGNRELIAKLEAEAAITASITHPNVVRVFSTGSDRGRFYLTMELVDKGTLDDLINLQGRVAEAQALNVGIQIAQGLRAAHQAGLIHRDVKPGNILFADAQTAKIVDFGLAIFMEDEEEARGEIWGTPYYVAPEKLERQPEDFRSDIYSLGGSLFHALAGRPPFEAEDATMVALKHLKSQAVRLQAFAPHVSGETAYVINRTLMKDPVERYQSYDELIEHLEYARAQIEEKAAQPPVPKQRLVLENEEQQRAMGWITAGVIGVILLLAIGAFIFRHQLFPRGAAPSGNAAETSAHAPARADDAFADARNALVAGDAAAAAEIYRKHANDSAGSPLRLAWARLGEGLAQLVAGKRNEARAAFREVLDHAPTNGTAGDEKVGTFLVEVARKLTSERSIDPDSARNLDRANHEALGLLLFALHDWSLGDVEKAAPLFREFRRASPRGRDTWIAELKPLATRFLEDFTSFEMASEQLQAAPSVEQKAAALVALRQLKGPFEARVAELSNSAGAEVAAYEKRLAAPLAEGLYKIIHRRSGKSLEVEGGQVAETARIALRTFDAAPHQQWRLTPRADGTYGISAAHSEKALSASAGKGTDVQQSAATDASLQRWRVESAGGGYFKIVAKGSGKALAAGEDSSAEGAGVALANEQSGVDQQWQIVPLQIALGEWTYGDVGTPAMAGSATRDDATGGFTVRGSGADIWEKADSFHFLQRPLSGDGELAARVATLENTHDWAKAGLMLRDGLSADARNVCLVVTSANGLAQQIRAARGGVTDSVRESGPIAPQWLKLVRKGDLVTGFYSADGRTWTQVAAQTLPNLARPVSLGLAVTSHVNGTAATAAFDHVTFVNR